jgi:uncharacterized protein YejL (UPF0352 family)
MSAAPDRSHARVPSELRYDRAIAAAALIFAGAVFASLSFRYWPFTVDDAFIIARYAENLSRHHLLAWNPGLPPTEGFTGIILLSLLALADKLGLNTILTAKCVGVVGTLATALALFGFALRAQRQVLAGAFAAALYLLWPATAVHAVGAWKLPCTACVWC